MTVSATGGQFDVLRGQVQVTDYKTGQFELVNQNQAARHRLTLGLIATLPAQWYLGNSLILLSDTKRRDSVQNESKS